MSYTLARPNLSETGLRMPHNCGVALVGLQPVHPEPAQIGRSNSTSRKRGSPATSLPACENGASRRR